MARVAVLWTRLSGYLNASLAELKSRGGKLLVSAYTPSRDAPFSEDTFRWLRHEAFVTWKNGLVDHSALLKQLVDFAPDIILVSGWNQSAYLLAARRFKGRALRVVCFDTPWLGSPRQQVACFTGRYWLKPMFERAFVPGERQLQMAIRLGFSPSDVIQGLYAPDTTRIIEMAPSALARKAQFLYVGRLVKEKGVHTLVHGYRRYRSSVASPWSLTVAGTGPLEGLLRNQIGIEVRGFVQPEALPSILYEASCMVVPSLTEPWGVQISEGATAGLPIIATTACGSAVHLVRHGFNGCLVAPDDPQSLADAMLAIHNCTALETYSVHSRQLAGQFTSSLWADNLLQSCRLAPGDTLTKGHL